MNGGYRVDNDLKRENDAPTINQQSSMSRAITLLFATACGMSVANIYFAQPLLDQLSNEFTIDHSIIGVVITITQIFYGLGLLLLVPLGDLLNQRRLIIGQMLLSITALVIVGTASYSAVLFTGMALVGLLAVVTQTLVAFAATMASLQNEVVLLVLSRAESSLAYCSLGPSLVS